MQNTNHKTQSLQAKKTNKTKEQTKNATNTQITTKHKTHNTRKHKKKHKNKIYFLTSKLNLKHIICKQLDFKFEI